MMVNQSSETLKPRDVSIVKRLLILGFQHKRIAALFDVNQGRISEINTGHKHPSILPYQTEIDEVVTYPLSKRNDR